MRVNYQFTVSRSSTPCLLSYKVTLLQSAMAIFIFKKKKNILTNLEHYYYFNWQVLQNVFYTLHHIYVLFIICLILATWLALFVLLVSLYCQEFCRILKLHMCLFRDAENTVKFLLSDHVSSHSPKDLSADWLTAVS